MTNKTKSDVNIVDPQKIWFHYTYAVQKSFREKKEKYLEKRREKNKDLYLLTKKKRILKKRIKNIEEKKIK